MQLVKYHLEYKYVCADPQGKAVVLAPCLAIDSNLLVLVLAREIF